MKNNDLYAAITRDVVNAATGSIIDEFFAGEIPSEVGPLPHHVMFYIPAIEGLETDLTIHFWEEAAAVVIFRAWELDTVLVERIAYGLDFADELRALLIKVESAFPYGCDLRDSVESLIATEAD